MGSLLECHADYYYSVQISLDFHDRVGAAWQNLFDGFAMASPIFCPPRETEDDSWNWLLSKSEVPEPGCPFVETEADSLHCFLSKTEIPGPGASG